MGFSLPCSSKCYQNLLLVFGHPYNTLGHVISAVAAGSIVFHTYLLGCFDLISKVSPRGYHGHLFFGRITEAVRSMADHDYFMTRADKVIGTIGQRLLTMFHS